MSENMPSQTNDLDQNTSTRSVMFDVIVALCPAAIYGCILFGIKAAVVLAVSVGFAVTSELIWNLLLKKKQTVGDLTAIVTGLLLGMTLSADTPPWIAAIGSIIAIIVVKQMFGGLSHNFANPVVVAKIILLLSYPLQLLRFSEPISGQGNAVPPFIDGSNLTLKQLFFGMHSGNIGETISFLLLIGGVYLALRRIISPIIPLTFIGIVAILSIIFKENLAITLFGGSLILVAVFVATDPATTPKQFFGKAIFGLGCGILCFIFEALLNVQGGTFFAILIMNILTIFIDKIDFSKIKLPVFLKYKEVETNE